MDPLMHMTPMHLAPLEQAARILCEMNGDDPDQQLKAKHPLGLDVPYTVPLWWQAAESLHHLNQMLVSLKRAAALTVADQNVKVRH